jgi:transposase-like protein
VKIKRRWTYLYHAVDSDGKTSISCCAPIGMSLQRKHFFQRAFKSQGRLPRAITLDGYQASHRAARKFLGEHRRGGRTEVRSSKHLNNLIEQDHRSIKVRLGPDARVQAISACVDHDRRHRTHASNQERSIRTKQTQNDWQNRV